MAGIQDFWEFSDDFLGGGTFGTTASENDPWVVTDTSAAGTPTYTRLDHGEATGTFAPGVAELALEATSEVQNVCLSFGDKLAFDIDNTSAFECRIRQGQATVDTTSSIAWGLIGDRNDALDTIAVAMMFKITASNTVVWEYDDASNTADDQTTGGLVLTNAWKRFKIDCSLKTDVKFYMDDANGSLVRVGSGVTATMANHTGGLQPFFQIQKTADTNADTVEIDYVKVWGTR